jgi:hypothetical protein
MAIIAMAVNAPLDRYVIDVLMPDLVGHDRRPSAFLVYLLIESLSDGREPMGYGTLAERTGLSRRACQEAVAHLARRRLIAIDRQKGNEAARFRALRPWRERT